MRHHPEDITSFIADAGNVIQRAVGIGRRGYVAFRCRITEYDAVLLSQLGVSSLIAEVIPFHVSDGNFQDFSLFQIVRKGSVSGFHAKVHLLADVLESSISKQSSGQESRFAEDLESVADPNQQAAVSGEFRDARHDRGKFCDGSCSQVIAVGKAPGNDDGVASLKIAGFMPEESGGLPGRVIDGIVAVMVAIGARENDDAEFHTAILTETLRPKMQELAAAAALDSSKVLSPPSLKKPHHTFLIGAKPIVLKMEMTLCDQRD
jgi:hypothetical protein